MKVHKAKQMYSSSTPKHNEHDSNCQHITRQICQVDTSVPATNQPPMSHSTLCYWREHRKWELGSIQLQVLYKLFVTELWASVHRSLHSQFSGCEREGMGWGWGWGWGPPALSIWLNYMVTTRNVTTGSLRLHPIWSYLYPYNAHKAVYTNQRKFCSQSLSHSCTRVYRSTAVFVFIATMSWDSQAKQIRQT